MHSRNAPSAEVLKDLLMLRVWGEKWSPRMSWRVMCFDANGLERNWPWRDSRTVDDLRAFFSDN